MYRLPDTLDMTEAKALVQEAEAAFEAQLSAIADAVIQNPDVQFLTVTGPSCSGKTTTTKVLCQKLEAAGRALYPVSLDDFYKNPEDVPLLPDGRIDYDTAKAIDLQSLEACIAHLLKEEPVDLPRFDFETKRRAGYVRYEPRENDIIVLEGIQAIYPEVKALLPIEHTFSIAIMPNKDVLLPDGSQLSRREIRLLRRIVRDARERATKAEKNLFMWETVTANEDITILPNLHRVDHFIDSFLPYELYVIRPYAETLLSEIPDDSVYADVRDHLLSCLSTLTALPSHIVPKDSVFREFIGEEREDVKI